MLQSAVFSVLMILLSKRRVSRDYLAERFSVSKRTVSRYVTILQDAGVPVVSTPGRNGGIALADDYMLDRTYLSEAETLRIKDALARSASSYSDRINLALIEKLDAVNKSRETNSYIVKQENLYIDGSYAQSESLRPKIRLLSQAIEQSREVEIKYTDAHGYVSFRTIDPYTLVFKDGNWYIYALCKLRGDFRLFKLQRIDDLRKTSKRFIRYDSNLTEKLGLEFYNDVYVELEFEFFPAVKQSIEDWLGRQAVVERGTKYVARAEVPLTDNLIKRLLAFGSSIRITSPQTVRDAIKEEAKRLYSIYFDE